MKTIIIRLDTYHEMNYCLSKIPLLGYHRADSLDQFGVEIVNAFKPTVYSGQHILVSYQAGLKQLSTKISDTLNQYHFNMITISILPLTKTIHSYLECMVSGIYVPIQIQFEKWVNLDLYVRIYDLPLISHS